MLFTCYNDKVEDKEGIQTKAWNYLFEVIGLRGMVEPELSHPKWNGFKKALKTADLEYSALRLTICSNFNHGAFKSGDKLHSKMESLQQYLSHQPEEYFEEQAELICFDRNEPVEPSAAKLALEDWMEAPSIKNRLKFVAAFVWCVKSLLLKHAPLLFQPFESRVGLLLLLRL